MPVLAGDRIVAALDLKADRQAGKLLIQSWHWLAEADAATKAAIDEELRASSASSSRRGDDSLRRPGPRAGATSCAAMSGF